MKMTKKKYGPKIGFTCGAFDLLHTGHVLMLEESKSVCDFLIVGVQSDPSIDRSEKNKPIQSYEERIISTKAVRFVDQVVLYDTEEDLYNLLKDINPDIRIIGTDHKDKPYTGDDLDIEVYFNSRNHDWSTSYLRERVYKAEKIKNEQN